LLQGEEEYQQQSQRYSPRNPTPFFLLEIYLDLLDKKVIALGGAIV